MFLKFILDGPKYIAVNKSLDYEAAKKHCSQRYESGSLCNFKDGSNSTECLTDFAKRESPNTYFCIFFWRLVTLFVKDFCLEQQDESKKGFFCQVNQGNKPYT
jgi:hypothetical protein